MTKKEAQAKQRQQYLHLMGIEQWLLRDVPLSIEEITQHSQVNKSELKRTTDQHSQGSESEFTRTAAKQTAVGESESQQSNLQQATAIETDVKSPSSIINPNLNAKTFDWPELQTAVQNCTVCDLSESRTRTVFGAGHPQARLMVIGAAPGDDEDRQGQPFMGKAGQLLTEMLAAIGFKRDQVFISNILKCRPLANREPSAVELACCAPFLARQISLVQPQVILAIGTVAAHSLLQSSENISRLRGVQHSCPGSDIPVYVSYHPSHLLRAPKNKGKAWQDLKQVLHILKQQETH
ncbi:Uracil-DNA glycosylase, family 4 [hydrothermal vent metagenome]|uniref:Type-4 uracil-DNA glycosylase n=1 Tax=hydrothermal vent metagenome TaxID=652676 RepID=A0A3B0YGA6_9ZZZZ